MKVKTNRIKKKTLLDRQPPEWPVSLLSGIQEKVRQSGTTIVVLDDDPTGTQTVYNIPVLTAWTTEMLKKELEDKPDLFYILTNSRSLPVREAESLNMEIGKNLVAASKKTKRPFVVVSRSDSTLRGHYPEEVDALVSTLNHEIDGYLIIPFFMEGGRLTIDDTHWVEEDEWLVPASETPFARDSYFGYANSNLKYWVEEKTKGKIKAEKVISVSIDDIRIGGPEKVFNKLMRLKNGAVCIVNSITLRDMEVFVHALLSAESTGKRFFYRTAASFVQVRAGLGTRQLLTPEKIMHNGKTGGLFIVGSYVPKSTRQLECLTENSSVFPIEVDVHEFLESNEPDLKIQSIVELTENKLKNGTDVVIYTSRKLAHGMNPVENLNISNRLSSVLVGIVSTIQTKPRFLVAKGGITSSDIATDALQIKRAMVMGQILPGVPVWKTGDESKFPGLLYIIFPGNVGQEDALVKILDIFSRSNI